MTKTITLVLLMGATSPAEAAPPWSRLLTGEFCEAGGTCDALSWTVYRSGRFADGTGFGGNYAFDRNNMALHAEYDFGLVITDRTVDTTNCCVEGTMSGSINGNFWDCL